MSNEELLKVIALHNTDDPEGFWGSIKKVVERREWHDLRKDPNDLPKDCDNFLTCVETYRKIAGIVTRSVCFGWYYPLNYNGISEGWDSDVETDFYKSKVIAWRKIPSFEE